MHLRQAHVDHLFPGTSALDVGTRTPDREFADKQQDESSTKSVPLEAESNPVRDFNGQELVTLRLTRNRHLPAQSIGEMTQLFMHALHFPL